MHALSALDLPGTLCARSEVNHTLENIHFGNLLLGRRTVDRREKRATKNRTGDVFEIQEWRQVRGPVFAVMLNP